MHLMFAKYAKKDFGSPRTLLYMNTHTHIQDYLDVQTVVICIPLVWQWTLTELLTKGIN